MSNSMFRKTMVNVRNLQGIKLVMTSKGRNRLALEPNYHTTKDFSEKLLAIKLNKT